MPAKRARAAHNNALTYWVAAIPDIPQSVEGARPKSFGKELVLDAHRWGEAMVRAHLQNLAGDGVSAHRRQNSFESDQSQRWYALGYRYWLLPTAEGAPADLASFKCPDLKADNAPTYKHIQTASFASRTWWERFAGDIRAEVQREALEEASRNAPAVAPIVRPAKRLLASPAGLSPATAIVPTTTGPPLPGRLRRLLDRPADAEPNAPRPGIDDLVAEAFRDQCLLRVWTTKARTGREISRYDAPTAHDLQETLDKRGLAAVYGSGCGSEERDAEMLRQAGLGECASGTFNTIWAVKNRASAQWVNDVLPPELAAHFLSNKLVLRTPVGSKSTGWSSKQAVIGEATNMLFTSLLHCGPRVGALGIARRLFRDKRSAEEGAMVVRYKLYAFIERATSSVDRRYVPSRGMRSRAVDSKPYHEALLMAIYQISVQGFVHMDATLRNFVDFYDDALPTALGPFAVKVIDVEAHTFRRLCPTKGTEWRHLLLLNLLTVLVFLKIRLGSGWIPSIHLVPVRCMCKQLLSELDGKGTIASLLLWEGPFVPDARYPNLAKGEYAGDTHEAASRAALQQLRHYLLQEPLDTATSWYIDVAYPQTLKPLRTDELSKAKLWFDTTYRGQSACVRSFFLDALRPRDTASRFVDVAFRFLETPLGDLQRRFPSNLPPTDQHTHTSGREFILGLV
jgi:hypothetical protein